MTRVHETDDEARKAFIRELRELAGWLADHPEVPVPSSQVRIQYSILDGSGDQPARYAEVVRLAELAGTAFTVNEFGCDADLWAGEHVKFFAHAGSDIAAEVYDVGAFARAVAEAALIS